MVVLTKRIMGEAKQRKLAQAAVRPWERDQPAPPRPRPWYMEGSTEPIPPAREDLLISLPPRDPTSDEALRTLVRQKFESEHGAGRVVIIGDDPRDLPVRRRMRPMDMAILLGLLGNDSLIMEPRRK